MSYKDLDWKGRDALETEAKAKPYLFFRAEVKNDSWDGEYRADVTLTVVFLHPEDNKPRNCGHKVEWEDLTFSARSYGKLDGSVTDLESWRQWHFEEPSYVNVYDLPLEKAEAMVKYLRSLKRKVDKIAERFGSTDTFYTMITRYADAMGICGFVKESSNRQSSWYAAGEYVFGNVGDVKYWLDTARYEMLKKAGFVD